MWWALGAHALSAEQESHIQGILSVGEWGLFQRFSDNDKQHSLRVLRLLESEGYDDLDLLKCALLHDVGKTKYPLRIIDRVVIVLVMVFAREKVSEWGESGSSSGFKRAFVIREMHPEWGAEMVREVEGSEQLCELIAQHQDKNPQNELVRIHQWADDQA